MFMWDTMLGMAWSGTTIQRVLNLVEMFLRAGEFIRYQEVFKVRLVSSGS